MLGQLIRRKNKILIQQLVNAQDKAHKSLNGESKTIKHLAENIIYMWKRKRFH